MEYKVRFYFNALHFKRGSVLDSDASISDDGMIAWATDASLKVKGHTMQSGQAILYQVSMQRAAAGQWEWFWSTGAQCERMITHTVTEVTDHKSMLIVDVELLFAESVKVDFSTRLGDCFPGTNEVLENFLSDIRGETCECFTECFRGSVFLYFRYKKINQTHSSPNHHNVYMTYIMCNNYYITAMLSSSNNKQ